MARIIPNDWRKSVYLHEGEKETIGWLADAMSDDYVIWAGVEWASREQSGGPIYGEIDLIVVGPSGALVMVEQKNGAVFVDEAGDIKKAYRTKEKSVGQQLRHSFTAFLKQWETAYGSRDQAPYITMLMYLPDHRIDNIASLQLHRKQLVDATTAKDLPRILEEALTHHPENPDKKRRVLEFLESQLALTLDVGASLENQEKVYRAQGGRLAQFVQTLSFSPWRLHVQGSAGSGKTQLAAALHARALRAGKRALYVCFNRPLAEKLSGLIAKGGVVATVDHLTEMYMGVDGPEQDRSDMNGRFESLRARALAAPPKPEWQFDALIVDEGQDFSAQQAAFIEHLLTPDAQVLWMEDARQKIQRREDTGSITTTLRMDLRENWRCGRAIVDYMNTFLRLDPPDIAASAIQGEMPELIILKEGDDVVKVVAAQVARLLNEDYLPTDIAVISDQGLVRSQLVKQERIGDWNTRRFLQDYEDGKQKYSAGELRVDTVYRFKGLQAAAVIYAEIDFEELTPQVLNRLYTGMTRARSSLTLVVSQRAADLLMASMG